MIRVLRSIGFDDGPYCLGRIVFNHLGIDWVFPGKGHDFKVARASADSAADGWVICGGRCVG